MYLQYHSKPPEKDNKGNDLVIAVVLLCYLMHVLVHTCHYVDNIYRPVDYFEPKWLYQRYVLSPMEITFAFNFIHTYFGVQYMNSLFIHRGQRADYSYLTAYVYSAMMTMMHYNVEVPHAYSPFVNFSIAGEGASIFLFVAAAFVIKQPPEPISRRDAIPYKLLILIFVTGLTGWIILIALGFSLLSVIALLLISMVVYKTLEVFSFVLDPETNRKK